MSTKKLKMLEEDDDQGLAATKAIVSERPPGRYKLKTLFGEHWQWVRRRRLFGQWFRAWVRAEELADIRWVRKRSDRCHEYEVLPRYAG